MARRAYADKVSQNHHRHLLAPRYKRMTTIRLAGRTLRVWGLESGPHETFFSGRDAKAAGRDAFDAWAKKANVARAKWVALRSSGFVCSSPRGRRDGCGLVFASGTAIWWEMDHRARSTIPILAWYSTLRYGRIWQGSVPHASTRTIATNKEQHNDIEIRGEPLVHHRTFSSSLGKFVSCPHCFLVSLIVVMWKRGLRDLVAKVSEEVG